MESLYDQAVALNPEIVRLVLLHCEKREPEVLEQIHNLLLPTTRSVIRKLIKDSGLPLDLSKDMLQEAFFKLFWACNYYDPCKSPVFFTYWRVALRRHLISQWTKQWRHKSIPETRQAAYRESLETRVFLKDLREETLLSYESLDQEQQRIARVIFTERVYCLPDEKTTFEQVRKILDSTYSNSYLLSWEKWIRADLKFRYPNTLI